MENEAFLSRQEEPGEYEIVVPSASVLCQPTVAVVDEVVDRRGSRAVAEEYLNYLYSDEAQKLAGENYYRPADQDIAKQFYTEEGTHEITELPSDGKDGDGCCYGRYQSLWRMGCCDRETFFGWRYL